VNRPTGTDTLRAANVLSELADLLEIRNPVAVGTVIAQAIADARAEGAAPFLALAAEYDRHAAFMSVSIGTDTDLITRRQAFEDAAASIRRAAREARP
jgi:hypothetical protein